MHVLWSTARRPLADGTPQGRAVGTKRPRLCATTQLALRGQDRALTKKTRKKKTCFFDEESDALRAVLWAAGPAPRARVFRKKLEEKEMHGNATGEKGASYMKRLCKKREQKMKKKGWLASFVDTI